MGHFILRQFRCKASGSIVSAMLLGYFQISHNAPFFPVWGIPARSIFSQSRINWGANFADSCF